MGRHTKIQLLIAVLALVIFIPFLGVVHLFDWDEINFAEAAREMIVTGNYSMVQIDYQPFWEKPPLFFWMQVISMKLFGVNEFAARFPNAICGLFSLLVLYRVGKRNFSEKFGVLWALMYAGSFLPHFYFKSGIIDPWFNLFIFLGIVHAIYVVKNRHEKQWKNVLLAGLFIGLAIMTKGPVALLIFMLSYGLYLMIKRFRNSMVKPGQLLGFILSMAAVGGIWFVIEYLNGRGYIIKDFIVYQVRLLQTQDAGHGGPFYYHFVVLLIGCFPASFFALKALGKRYRDEDGKTIFIHWMKILFWVVLILFSLVKTKIVHYSSMCYFPLTFLGTLGAMELLENSGKNKWVPWVSSILGGILATLLISIPFIDRNKEKIMEANWIKDPFAIESLRADVYWSGYEWLIGLLLVIGLILFLINFNKKRMRAIGTLFVTTVLVLNLVATIYVPRIEQYSQNAAIEFYKSKQQEDCYVSTIGFKSYADLFYTRKMPGDNKSHDDTWLLYGEVDKPVYMVSKVNQKEKIKKNYPHLEFMGEKNGYTFYRRMQ